ncbi:MAG: tetratricopeptide repeat protein [Chloroflexota bacterium]
MPNKKWLLPLIMTLVVAAVFLPMLFTGYSEIRQGEESFAAGDYEQAAAAFEHAARLLPWRNDLYEKAGISAGAAGDTAAAIRYLHDASQLSEQGWLTLASAYYTEGDLEAALQTAQSGLKGYPSSAGLYELMAFIHRGQKDPDAERAALQNQVLFDGEDVYAHYRLGLLLIFSDPEQAAAELSLASSLDPEFDPAVQTLLAALELAAAETNPSTRAVTIGRALGLVDEWDLALAAFEDAIELDASNAEAWAWLGEAKQQTGGGGRAELDRALSLEGKSAIVRALRGMYWSRQEEYDLMLTEYAVAEQVEPENPAWQASIGDAHYKRGDLAAALTAYQRATELAPEESTYWRLLAVLCAESGVHVEEIGLPAAQKAVELAPDEVAALDVLGWSYASSGRYFSAEQTLLDVIARAPNYLPAHLHLAMTYLAEGNQAAAFKELTFVRDADPEGENGQVAVELLERYFP